MTTRKLELFALPDMPLVRPGDDLAAIIGAGLEAAGTGLEHDDVLIVAQKIVSKAEGRYVDLATVTPSAKAEELATATEKDARLVELILQESTEVVRYCPGVLIVAHRSGIVLANAGIDASNVDQADDGERVLLLPIDAEASCRRLRQELGRRFAANIAVIVNDSVGRAWRNGTVGLAIGADGVPALADLRGEPDLFGRPLMVSQEGIADELASAASLLQGQGAEGQPVVLARGLNVTGDANDATALLRPAEQDLFR
jgi:coenzyme F420-0:L-glutamate ligase/coenzyme F420-1:gamma-L-glutamate ligase